MKRSWLLVIAVALWGCSSDTGNVTTSEAPGDTGSDSATGPELGDGPENTPADQSSLKPVAIDGGVAELSAANTKIQFVGTHMPPREPEPRTGVFEEFSGRAEVDVAAQQLNSVAVEIKTESLTTSIERLTNHLRSPDFFSVRDYPTAKFESTSIESGADAHQITGNLTLMETTKEISFPAQVSIDEDGLTLSSEFTIDRTEFGMVGQEGVAKEVTMTVVIGEPSALPTGGGGDFGAGRGGRGGGGGGGPDAAERFARLDADGDGKVAGDEIPSWMANNMEAFDTDSDGAITQEEMQARFGQFRRGGGGGGGGGGPRGGGGGGGGFDPTLMFANMDANQDGKLTGDEIPGRMRENMAAIDTNQDGSITLEELEERFRQMRASGGFGGRGGGGRRGGEDRPERPERPETE